MDENATGTVNFARALRFAAVRQAPSIVPARPWRWEMDLSRLRLHLERDGQRHGNDAHDRLPVISCGIALHHARIVLAACGVLTAVRTALSAVLLTATDAGLAAAPDRCVGGMMGRLPGGFGFPQIGLRFGHAAARTRNGALRQS